MTRFGVTAVLAAFGIIMVVVLKPESADTIDFGLLIMASFLLGALVAVEARQTHIVWKRNGKERHAEESEE